MRRHPDVRGFTLIELVVFIAVVAIALSTLLLAFNRSVTTSVDPLIKVRLLELCQSQLDEVIARKYDENTPTGGIPACGSAEDGAINCAGIGLDSGESLADRNTLDDVDDFNGYSATPYSGYNVAISVALAGSELGLTNDQAKRVTVTATAPGGDSITLSTYRVNF